MVTLALSRFEKAFPTNLRGKRLGAVLHPASVLPDLHYTLDLLKEYGVDAVLAGHTHKDYDTVFEGIRLVAANPVCNGIGHGQPGFNTVSVNKDGFEIEFHPTPGFDPAKCRL